MDLRRVLKKKVRRNRRLTALAAHGHYHEIEGSLEKLARERKILSLRRWQPRYFKAMVGRLSKGFPFLPRGDLIHLIPLSFSRSLSPALSETGSLSYVLLRAR